ncbi:MAG: hypothetical protein KA191_05290 [Verrucomicrobia bacterium]|nr:hypothetical protein [Verrucomicrobiota bacterium]OQC65683.1 MAG: hypothetical protein BWX48_02270 [Verrucomicrobia bacterium ADurb.Bin006]MDI9379405.1 hypothetical protein [Verrucomicrobiota bacterium]NMD22393.1 hypothetical protein [Verrucomicrobiota bacterium]HOA60405.1 hypothetical protein [Verrucomicrobiota bacterium]
MITSPDPSVPPRAGDAAEPRGANHLRVEIERDAEGKPKAFTLTLAKQTVVLRSGTSWLKTDEFKWVTRGLIEAPQSFQVESNGTVDINGEKIALDDPEGAAKLEHELNKHHIVPPKKKAALKTASMQAVSGPRVPHFDVKLDQFGHLLIVCTRGAERVETGLRGLPSLVQNRLMLAPKQSHVDPLHRGIDLDGTFYEATEDGARQLAEILNTRYAPSPEDDQDTAIEIKENPAAATGFDIHFVTVVSGARFEVKGHLSQERLDLLQDSARCDLLKPGIILRLTPPHMLFRRRRPDGGEEHIPELPDIQYRRITAPELQRLFNHPIIRRGGESAAAAALHSHEQDDDLVELRVTRNPQHKKVLWLEISTTAGGAPGGRAFTHHNIADLQEAGVFLPHLDVSLSLDHCVLSILNIETRHEDKLILDSQSPDSTLDEAGRMLTAALKPPRPRPPAPAPTAPVPESPSPPPALVASPPSPAPPAPRPPLSSAPSPAPPASATSPQAAVPPAQAVSPAAPTPDKAASPPPQPQAPPPPPAPPPAELEPLVDPSFLALFEGTSPLDVNLAVFNRLAALLGMPAQDILLTLPRAFTDRRFQILSFSHSEIDTILDLRSETFYGFYLTHVSEQKVLLVYACKGRHIEWGPDRCLLQPGVSAEPNEYKHGALLGLAQDADSQFAFIVTPAYRDWAQAFAPAYRDVCARFVTPREIALEPDRFTLIWPERQA